MKKESSFPNWFRNTLSGIGVWYLFVIAHQNFTTETILIIVFCYPIFLYWILATDGWRDEDNNPIHDERKPAKGRYFFNISLCIVGFFTLILLVDYSTFIEFSGRIINSRFTILLSNYIDIQKASKDYSFWAVPLYIAILLYFILWSYYLSNKVRISIDKDNKSNKTN